MKLEQEAELCRAWVATVPESERDPNGAWFGDYVRFTELTSAVRQFLESRPVATWSDRELSHLLFILALEDLDATIDAITRDAETLVSIAEAAAETDQQGAKWQLVFAMAYPTEFGLTERMSEVLEDRILSVLLRYSSDAGEYVRRLAMLALAERGAPQSESLAFAAWETGEEYQRIAALHVLGLVGSSRLLEYVALALLDGREFVVRAAHDAQATGRA